MQTVYTTLFGYSAKSLPNATAVLGCGNSVRLQMRKRLPYVYG